MYCRANCGLLWLFVLDMCATQFLLPHYYHGFLFTWVCAIIFSSYIVCLKFLPGKWYRWLTLWWKIWWLFTSGGCPESRECSDRSSLCTGWSDSLSVIQLGFVASDCHGNISRAMVGPGCQPCSPGSPPPLPVPTHCSRPWWSWASCTHKSCCCPLPSFQPLFLRLVLNKCFSSIQRKNVYSKSLALINPSFHCLPSL